MTYVQSSKKKKKERPMSSGDNNSFKQIMNSLTRNLYF